MLLFELKARPCSRAGSDASPGLSLLRGGSCRGQKCFLVPFHIDPEVYGKRLSSHDVCSDMSRLGGEFRRSGAALRGLAPASSEQLYTGVTCFALASRRPGFAGAFPSPRCTSQGTLFLYYTTLLPENTVFKPQQVRCLMSQDGTKWAPPKGRDPAVGRQFELVWDLKARSRGGRASGGCPWRGEGWDARLSFGRTQGGASLLPRPQAIPPPLAFGACPLPRRVMPPFE